MYSYIQNEICLYRNRDLWLIISILFLILCFHLVQYLKKKYDYISIFKLYVVQYNLCNARGRRLEPSSPCCYFYRRAQVLTAS